MSSTFGSLCAKRIFQDVCHILAPSILHSRLRHLPVVQALLRSEVIPQVLHRLDMVLLFSGEDGVEGFQLIAAIMAGERKNIHQQNNVVKSGWLIRK